MKIDDIKKCPFCDKYLYTSAFHSNEKYCESYQEESSKNNTCDAKNYFTLIHSPEKYWYFKYRLDEQEIYVNVYDDVIKIENYNNDHFSDAFEMPYDELYFKDFKNLSKLKNKIQNLMLFI